MSPHPLSATLAAAVALVWAGGISLGCRPSRPATPAPAPASVDSINAAQGPASAPYVYALPPVECAFAGGGKTAARVGVAFYFADKTLQAEIAGKTGELTRLVQFVLSSKRPAEINAETLKGELMGRLDPLLPPGKVKDIAFHFELYLKDSL